MRPNILVGKPSKQLCIPHGITFQQLQDTLQKQGYVAHIHSFHLLARFLRYDRRVIPGAYQLKANMSNWEAIRLLRAGIQHPVKLVLHHISTKAELADKITRNLEMRPEDFSRLLNDPTFVGKYGFTTENVMTMFIPNTYEVYWTTTSEALFARMYREYQRFWHADRLRLSQRLQMTPQEVTILASIVQNEAFRREEAPMIAGVFINRLKKGIPLQSDVTVWHAVGDTSIRRILHKDTKVNSSYNTYQYKGLPPGPLNVPSIAMIDAVLNFAEHNYLFFCGKEDMSGYTYFSKTLREHLNHARRYQKVLNQARIYR
ncbi:MAG: endolytic transglycosylase MltG [Roseivirga sp.]